MLTRDRLLRQIGVPSRTTIISAPRGFGKSVLVDQWEASKFAAGFQVRRISAPTAPFSRLQFWQAFAESVSGREYLGKASRAALQTEVAEVVAAITNPLVIVVDRPAPPRTENFGAELARLANLSRFLHVIVMARSLEPYVAADNQLAIPAAERWRRVLGPEDLRFTHDEIGEWFSTHGVVIDATELQKLHIDTNGLAALVNASGSLKSGTDIAHPGHIRHQDRAAPSAVARWIDEGSAEAEFAPPSARRLLLVAAMLGGVSERTAATIIAGDDPVAAFDAAEAFGLLPSHGHQRRLAPEVARDLVDRMVHRQLSSLWPQHNDLSDSLLAAGDVPSAIRCLITVEDWTKTVVVLRLHFARLIATDVEFVVEAFEQIPAWAAQRDPVVNMGRAAFVGISSGIVGSAQNLKAAIDTLARLSAERNTVSGALPAVFSELTFEVVQLRLTGSFAEASALAGELGRSVPNFSREHRIELSEYLPVLRAQWAVTHQLAGDFAASEQQARLAYSEAVTAGLDFIAKHMAGILALELAVRGETNRAQGWLTSASSLVDPPNWLGERTRAPAQAAEAIIAVDRLDLNTARQALATFGEPDDAEELWAIVTIAQMIYERLRGNFWVALDIGDRAIARFQRWCPPSSTSHIGIALLRSDAFAGLGKGPESQAALRGLSNDAAVVRGRTALAMLLSGDVPTTLELINDVGENAYWPRAFIETMQVRAAASVRLGAYDTARVSLQRASSVAASTGLIRPMLTLPRRLRRELIDTGVADDLTIDIWLRNDDIDLFPLHLNLIQLTARETEILELITNGTSRRAIAERLFVSENTIKTQMQSLYRKLDVSSRDEAVAAARGLSLF